MSEHTYTVELIEELPEEIPLKRTGTITTRGEWYGHSYADVVGRIYADGTVKSFFTDDIESGTTRLFDILRYSGKVKKIHRCIWERDSLELKDCDDYYVLRKVKGHTSERPTETETRLDTICNVDYEYVYEILLVANDEYRRYLTESVKTRGLGPYSIFDSMHDWEETFEEWAEYEENGFREDDDGGIEVLFYDELGNSEWIYFDSAHELLLSMNSVRMIEIKEEIVERE